MNTITQLHDSSEVSSLLQEVDAVALKPNFAVNGTVKENALTVSQLRVAAHLSLAETLAQKQVDDLLKELDAEALQTKSDTLSVNSWHATYHNWSGYIDALQNAEEVLTLDHLFSFATAALLAKRSVEVRSMLHQKAARDVLDSALNSIDQTEWMNHVKVSLTAALLLLVGHNHYRDVACAKHIMLQLATDQRQFESEWLSSQNHARREASLLLGFYHIGQAVIRLSDILLAGLETNSSLPHSNGQVGANFASELRHLLIRAEEYLSISNDLETLFWLNAVAVILWRLRTDSIGEMLYQFPQ